LIWPFRSSDKIVERVGNEFDSRIVNIWIELVSVGIPFDVARIRRGTGKMRLQKKICRRLRTSCNRWGTLRTLCPSESLIKRHHVFFEKRLSKG
jgi:hypothetical protein